MAIQGVYVIGSIRYRKVNEESFKANREGVVIMKKAIVTGATGFIGGHK